MLNTLVGFTASHGLSAEAHAAAIANEQRVVGRFAHLGYATVRVGATCVQVWGHGDLAARMHRMADGALLVLVGSPLGDVDWRVVEAALLASGATGEFAPPWDGRFNLLKVSADGEEWALWNDWVGSIPVFHARCGGGRIASTLEPVVVAAAGYRPEDIFLPGLVSLLINGHFLGEWTLFEGMRVTPPDSVALWDGEGFRSRQLWTVAPSQARWEAGWDDLVDEMYALSRQAILDVLKTQPSWTLPLSSGLDSRLIAAVGAEAGVELHAYAWGGAESTDVVYSRQIARTLGLPWRHIELPADFLVRYTPRWAEWYGSSMHFHGMYMMAFLDAIEEMPGGPILSGFVGETLAGEDTSMRTALHAGRESRQILGDQYTHWTVDRAQRLLKDSIEGTLAEIAEELRRQVDAAPGAFYQKLQFLELWSRQRFFTNFQITLLDYWRGVATPYLNRDYARFCMSLPCAVLDDRRLLADVYRRYYGQLAVIPGTYASQPFIPTGRYLLKERVAKRLPSRLAVGPLRGFKDVQLRMDMVSVQACGKDALWPIYDAWEELAEWLDVGQLEVAYASVMRSTDDIRPLRQLQSVQTLALRLLNY
jgi:hypothetical protein